MLNDNDRDSNMSGTSPKPILALHHHHHHHPVQAGLDLYAQTTDEMEDIEIEELERIRDGLVVVKPHGQSRLQESSTRYGVMEIGGDDIGFGRTEGGGFPSFPSSPPPLPRSMEVDRERERGDSPPGMAMDESEDNLDGESELLSPSPGSSLVGGGGGGGQRRPVVIEVVNEDDEDDVMGETQVSSMAASPPPPFNLFRKPIPSPPPQPTGTLFSVLSRDFPKKGVDPRELIAWYESVGRDVAAYRDTLAQYQQNPLPPDVPILPETTVMRLLKWVCTAIRPRVEFFGNGIMDPEEVPAWVERNELPQGTYHVFAETCLGLLGRLLMLPYWKSRTIDMEIAWALATFLFPAPPPNSWNSQKLFGIATRIVERFDGFRQEMVLAQVLEEMMKPLFVDERAGKTGRGSAAGGAGGVQEAIEKGKTFRRKPNYNAERSGDMFTDISAYPWVYDRIETVMVLSCVVHFISKAVPILPANRNNPVFPQLIVPPILALFDSPHLSPHRIQAVELTIMLLNRTPEHIYAGEFLKKKGLVNLFWRSVMAQMSYLPPLTPQPQATRMMRSAGYLLMLLLNLLTPPPSVAPTPHRFNSPSSPLSQPYPTDSTATSTTTTLTPTPTQQPELVKLTHPLPFRQLEVLRKVVYPLHATQSMGLMCVMCDILIALLPTLYLPVLMQELKRIVVVLAEGILGNPFVRRKELVVKATKALFVLLRNTAAWVRLPEEGRWMVIVDGCVIVWRRLTKEREVWERDRGEGGEEEEEREREILWGGDFEGWESEYEWELVKKELQIVVSVVGATMCRDASEPEPEVGAAVEFNDDEGGGVKLEAAWSGNWNGGGGGGDDGSGARKMKVGTEAVRKTLPQPRDPKHARLVEGWRELVDGYLQRDGERLKGLFDALVGTSRSCLRFMV